MLSIPQIYHVKVRLKEIVDKVAGSPKWPVGQGTLLIEISI
jgi:hypothetical protein